MIRIAVRVTPKAGRDEVVGWRDGTLRVRVSSAPEKGKATDAACALVASALGVPKSAVRLERGAKSRLKTLVADGVTDADLERAFGRR